MLGEVRVGSGSADVERKRTYIALPYLLLVHEGGRLSIATQEPKLSRGPSFLWSRPGFRSGLMLGEACAWPGSAGVEHKQVGKGNIKFKELKSEYYNPYCRLGTKRKFKCLLEASCMCRNRKKDRNDSGVTCRQQSRVE